MAQLKSTNILGNLAVTGDIVASSIKIPGGAASKILLANGDKKTLSELGLKSAAYTDSSEYATSPQGSNADAAYAWGNHASAGYLTSGGGDLAFTSGGTWSSFSIGKVSKYGILTLYKNNTYMDIKIDGTLANYAELKIPTSGGTIATQGWVSTNYLPLTAGYDKQLTGTLYANKPIGIRGTFDSNIVPTDVLGVAYLAYNSSNEALEFIFN